MNWDNVPNYPYIDGKSTKPKAKEITLKEFLLNWSPPLPKQSQLAEPEKLIRAFEKIKHLLNGAQPRIPTRYDLNETYQILRKSALKDAPLQSIINTLSHYDFFDTVEKIHLHRAPFVVFNFPNENECELGGNKAFTNNYLKWLEDTKKIKAH